MLDDDGKLKQRFYNKQVNARKEGLEFKLTLQQFKKLLRSAGITSSQCGIRGYHLARNNDSGPYAVGNCAFVWYKENLLAKKSTNKSRRASQQNIQKAISSNKTTSRASISYRISKGIKESPKVKEIRSKQKAARNKQESQKHPSYKGKNNSQYGTYWITNGKVSKKWSDRLGRLPRGFHLGRVV